MNFKAVLSMLLELHGTLKFFPSEPSAHVALARMVCQWAKSEAEVRDLVDAMLHDFDEWPGPRTFRETFNRLHRPALGPAERVPFPSAPLPRWFLDWSMGSTLALPEPAGTAITTVEELSKRKSMVKLRPRSKVTKMPIVKRAPYVRSAEEQKRLDEVEADIQRVLGERKKGA